MLVRLLEFYNFIELVYCILSTFCESAGISATAPYHNDFAIFRKFSKLNYQNLLYLQAELTHLEANLKKVADRDGGDPNRELYSKDWWFLAQNEAEHDSGSSSPQLWRGLRQPLCLGVIVG